MEEYNFKNSSVIIFIIITIIYVLNNISWWILNTPILPDNASSVHFYNIFENKLLYYNAPLITWIMKIMFSIFGKGYFDLQIIILNYFFFLIALYFIYKIGLELKNKETGNIAMVLFALTPAVYGMSRQYGHQDWHVMVAMTANIYCLIKLNDFKDRKWSILYGITVGLGLLVKDAFLAYFFVPWLYVAIRSLIEKTETKKIINILITILLGSLIAGCHYFRSDIINKVLNEPITEPAPIFCFESLRITTIGLSEYLLSMPIFLFFLIGFLYFFIKYKNRNKWILILWFVVPWLIIIFMSHRKEPEYGVPLIPVMILFASLWISNIKKYLIKKFILIFIISICLFQFITISYAFCDNIYNVFSFIYKQNTVMLFNNKSNLVFYDKSANELNKELLSHLKKFSKYSFVIPTATSMKLLPLALINDLNINTTWFDDENILKYDIFILIGKDLDILNLTDSIVSMIYARVSEPKELLYEKIKNKVTENFQKIKDNYYLIENFYLQNIEDEEHFVRLYKKKEKTDIEN